MAEIHKPVFNKGRAIEAQVIFRPCSQCLAEVPTVSFVARCSNNGGEWWKTARVCEGCLREALVFFERP